MESREELLNMLYAAQNIIHLVSDRQQNLSNKQHNLTSKEQDLQSIRNNYQRLRDYGEEKSSRIRDIVIFIVICGVAYGLWDMLDIGDIAYRLWDMLGLVDFVNAVGMIFGLLSLPLFIIALFLWFKHRDKSHKAYIDSENEKIERHNAANRESERVALERYNKASKEYNQAREDYNHNLEILNSALGDWYPPKYISPDAVDFFCQAVENYRANNITEAVREYENDVHNKTLEREARRQTVEMQKQTEEAERQTDHSGSPWGECTLWW